MFGFGRKSGNTSQLEQFREELRQATNVTAQLIADKLSEFSNSKTVNVSGHNALKLGAVYASTRLLSETVASLPIHVYERTPTGKRLAMDHQVYTLLNQEPNPGMTSFTLQELEVNNELIGGYAISEIVRKGGVITSLLPIANDQVKSITRGTSGVLYYDLADGRKLTSYDVTHHIGLTLDGVNGMGVIEYARLSIENGMLAETYGKDFFAKGTNPSVYISHPGKLSIEALKGIKDYWVRHNSGMNNAHDPAIIDQGMKVERLTVSPRDAQFIEGREFTVIDIARWFGVPPHKIGALEKTTIGNVEEQNIQFATDRIRPICEKREQEYDRKLFIGKERGKYFVKYDMMAMLRGNMQARADYYQKMVDMAALTPNQVLGFENMEPYEGGDVHWKQQGFARVESWEQDTKQVNANGNG